MAAFRETAFAGGIVLECEMSAILVVAWRGSHVLGQLLEKPYNIS